MQGDYRYKNLGYWKQDSGRPFQSPPQSEEEPMPSMSYEEVKARVAALEAKSGEREPQRTPPPPARPQPKPEPEKKPPEKEEPDEGEEPDDARHRPIHQPPPQPPPHQTQSMVGMSVDQFERMLETIRRGPRDEKKEQRMKQWREHNKRMQKDDLQLKINRFRNCNHMQMPGSVLSGCSMIAWATQSDNKRRGTCQRCGTVFSPERSECIHDEVWQSYKMMIRVPVHPSGNMNTIFTSA